MKNSYEQINYSLEKASKLDIPQILEIQNELLLDTKSSNINTEGKESGFLLHNNKEDDFEKAVSNPDNYLLVSKSSLGEIEGYILAGDLDKYISKEEWIKDKKIFDLELFKKKILYGIQLAVKKRGVGVGPKLNNGLFIKAKEDGFEVYIADICEGIDGSNVYNKNSIEFHKKNFGMKKIGEYKEGKIHWGIYAKEL